MKTRAKNCRLNRRKTLRKKCRDNARQHIARSRFRQRGRPLVHKVRVAAVRHHRFRTLQNHRCSVRIGKQMGCDNLLRNIRLGFPASARRNFPNGTRRSLPADFRSGFP